MKFIRSFFARLINRGSRSPFVFWADWWLSERRHTKSKGPKHYGPQKY